MSRTGPSSILPLALQCATWGGRPLLVTRHFSRTSIRSVGEGLGLGSCQVAVVAPPRPPSFLGQQRQVWQACSSPLRICNVPYMFSAWGAAGGLVGLQVRRIPGSSGQRDGEQLA